MNLESNQDKYNFSSGNYFQVHEFDQLKFLSSCNSFYYLSNEHGNKIECYFDLFFIAVDDISDTINLEWVDNYSINLIL